MRHLGSDRPVHVIPLAARDLSSHPQEAVPGLANRFLLHVSRLAPSKNVVALLEMAALWPDMGLVLAGAASPYSREIAGIVRQRALQNVTVLEDISDAQKAWLFAHCEGFVFPSLSEGFGLPPLEAMHFGKPVFLSRLTSLPEIGGEAACYWDDFEPEHMKHRVTQTLASFGSDDARRMRDRAASFFMAPVRTAARCVVRLAADPPNDADSMNAAAKVLVTGALGQDGAYLCDLALREGCVVIGGVRDVARAGGDRGWRLRHLGIAERVELVEMDLSDARSIDAALRAHQPDTVFNLAAQSSVARSFELPLETAAANGMGAVQLFESARRSSRPMRVVQAASADILAGGLDGPVNGTSPYGAAKAFAHLMARVYRDSLSTFVSSAILYNHESPLRGREFVTRKIIAALVNVRAGRQDRLLLGNLAARRDWSHARDIVQGLWRIAAAAQPGEFALGSGETHTVLDFVDRAARALHFTLRWRGSGLDEQAIDAATGRTIVAVDPALFRPTDVSHGAADLSRARALGWQPRTSLDAMIREMIQFETSGNQP